MGLMQKILGSAETTGRRTSADRRATGADRRATGAGRTRTPRNSRAKVPTGRSRPAIGWGTRNKRRQPQSGLARLMGSFTRRR